MRLKNDIRKRDCGFGAACWLCDACRHPRVVKHGFIPQQQREAALMHYSSLDAGVGGTAELTQWRSKNEILSIINWFVVVMFVLKEQKQFHDRWNRCRHRIIYL